MNCSLRRKRMSSTIENDERSANNGYTDSERSSLVRQPAPSQCSGVRAPKSTKGRPHIERAIRGALSSRLASGGFAEASKDLASPVKEFWGTRTAARKAAVYFYLIAALRRVNLRRLEFRLTELYQDIYSGICKQLSCSRPTRS